jgi:hypothetical protein
VSLIETEKQKENGFISAAMGAAAGAAGSASGSGNNGHGAQTCCNVCMEQLYPPRDWSDVNTFLELTHQKMKQKMKQQKKAAIRTKGFLGGLSKAVMGAAGGASGTGGGRMAPMTAPPCGCRLCKDSLVRKWGILFVCIFVFHLFLIYLTFLQFCKLFSFIFSFLFLFFSFFSSFFRLD